jgi:uncharacterized membrane protein
MKRKKQKSKKTASKIIATLAFSGILIILILNLTSPIHQERIQSKFIAGAIMGFDLSPGYLNFGQIIPGSGAQRKINITNTFGRPTRTEIIIKGEVSSCVEVSKNNIILQPNQTKEVTFSCIVPRGTEYGEYPGEIIIKTYKA